MLKETTVVSCSSLKVKFSLKSFKSLGFDTNNTNAFGRTFRKLRAKMFCIGLTVYTPLYA